jgi:hypothetical protein
MKYILVATVLVGVLGVCAQALADSCTDLGRGMQICRDNQGNVKALPNKNSGADSNK